MSVRRFFCLFFLWSIFLCNLLPPSMDCRDFHLILRPGHSGISPDTEFVDGAGNPFPFDINDLVEGHLYDDLNSFAHGNLHKGRFSGVVHTSKETYYIEPAGRHFSVEEQEQNGFHSVVYRGSDVTHPNGTCGHDPHHLDDIAALHAQLKMAESEAEDTRQAPRHRYRRGLDLSKIECRIQIAGDHTYAADVALFESKCYVGLWQGFVFMMWMHWKSGIFLGTS